MRQKGFKKMHKRMAMHVGIFIHEIFHAHTLCPTNALNIQPRISKNQRKKHQLPTTCTHLIYKFPYKYPANESSITQSLKPHGNHLEFSAINFSIYNHLNLLIYF